ncbi:hypothetical protein KOAAANKH_02674 [Brevundimonas sp. NIBR10]|nr:hypothetical protein KOAAANKH_02674 [Brevundimonas sp. NIBR10]
MLRSLGHDVLWALEDGHGLSDVEQARRAFTEKRIAVSADYDFGELAARRMEPFIGLILLSPSLEMEGEATEVLAHRIHDCLLRATGHILILEPERVRERPL